MSREQMLTLKRIMFDSKKNREKFKNQKVLTSKLMNSHRQFFKIVDNLHDLLCRGNLDARKAL